MVATEGEEIAKQEKILVLVRLRPLNEKEIIANEAADWECINDTTILYRNTLREGSTFPSAYTFDRVFQGDSPTRQVYDDGAKEIALSVVKGINSSIFAYGQTSSGKTYTMTGITEYAVADIFDYIQQHEERAFVLKLSAIEIYNESIRDLLSTDNTPLRLRDDPEKGVLVEKVTEETLRSLNHFKELLSLCEAQRRIGETSLNEKSSRSHQILKLTVESSAREFLGKDNSTSLAASVNFVDLAGSERASQALSAGSRLKEGCHINRSLLTLGTVIRKLSKGRSGHINYRDSKLTRILQPALGGNARTAIICTLSPARSHVEQTRNTLLFACCAKEVTTKAQVNIVMSDKALVKQLQRELARLESELRAPAPASSTCNCAAVLRKKDLQIEKMEKEIRELTKQRNLAQSRVEDLLQLIGNDQDSIQAKVNGRLKRQATDSWDDEGSVSEMSSVAETTYPSREKKSVRSDSCQEDRCIEMEDSSRENNDESHALYADDNDGISATTSREDDANSSEAVSNTSNIDGPMNHNHNGFTYGALEQNLQDVKKTIDSLVTPYADESYPHPMAVDGSSGGNIRFTRSWSCRGTVGLSPAAADHSESTPPNGYERNFSGRPDRNFVPFDYDAGAAKLLRSDSQSSDGSASVQSKNPGDEDMPSIGTFISGLKKAKLQYEKELADGQGKKADEFERNVRDMGSDPMQGASGVPSDRPFEFEKQQRAILELWQICNVSLVHRTYFFLLFKGDQKDSIYMEVELRRLTYLKESFSQGSKAMQDGQSVTLASSMKSLRREKEMLSRLMRRRFSAEERNRLFEKWGIGLRTKRRRLQLANLLWSNPKDMNHVTESAAIVAKLIRFVEHGQALKEMFGLSFTPPGLKRRSLGWKRSMASLF